MKHRLVSSLALIWIVSVNMLSCAQTGDSIAINHSESQSGPAYLSVNVPVVTFGDKVAEAATKGIDAYLQTIKGPVTAAEKAIAVSKGVEAGLAQANAEEKTVTEANKKELQEKVEQTVEEKAQKKALSKRQ